MSAGNRFKQIQLYDKESGQPLNVDLDGKLVVVIEDAVPTETLLSKRPAILDTTTGAAGTYTATLVAAQGAGTKIVVKGWMIANRTDGWLKFHLYHSETTNTSVFNNSFPAGLSFNWNMTGANSVSMGDNKPLKLVVPNNADFDILVQWDVV